MYTYQVLVADTLVTAEQLNSLASEGWRLVVIVPTGGKFFFYFERPVEPGSHP